MTADPGYDPEKKSEVCPYCKEERGKEHKKSCGLWSPYSTSQWVKQPKETPAAMPHIPWPFPVGEQWPGKRQTVFIPYSPRTYCLTNSSIAPLTIHAADGDIVLQPGEKHEWTTV